MLAERLCVLLAALLCVCSSMKEKRNDGEIAVELSGSGQMESEYSNADETVSENGRASGKEKRNDGEVVIELPGGGQTGSQPSNPDETVNENGPAPGKGKNSKRKAGTGVNTWPNAVVPWKFDEKRPFKEASSRNMVWDTIYHWQNLTCLRFPYRTNEITYVSIGTGSDCSCHVGMLYAEQQLVLNEANCMHPGTVSHELGHAIGFQHEQSRSDRDRYVKILWDNIREDSKFNFKKEDTSVNVEYDLTSNMQYSLKAFSKNGRPTIEVKNKELSQLVGSRSGLTFYDVKMANLLYNCKGSCTNQCENHGYPFKEGGICICKCPRGLTGKCDVIDKDVSDYPYCGGVFTLKNSGDKVTIQSPNYPNNYDLNKICVYVIKGPQQANSGIILTFEDFELDEDPSSRRCRHSLEINANLIGQKGLKYCGSFTKAPQRAHTFLDHRSKEIMLTFNTHGGGTPRKGFSFTARATNDLDPCLKCGPRTTCEVSGSSSSCKCLRGYTGSQCDQLNDYKLVNCNFDRSICHWQQNKDDDRDWTKYKHKDGTAYVYGWGSPAKPGATAVLSTLFIPGNTYCFKFKWVMFGSDPGNLKVTSETATGVKKVLWSTAGEKSTSWQSEEFTINSPSKFKIKFEGTFTASYQSGIVIDEVSMLLGSCGSVSSSRPPTTPLTNPSSLTDVSCDFENGDMCKWKLPSSGMNVIKWIVNSGTTPTKNTGPNGGAGGSTKYLYAEMTGSNLFEYDFTEIESPLITGGSYCFSLSYNMNGDDIGLLEVTLHDVANDQFNTIWRKEGKQGNVWIPVRFSLLSKAAFKILITAYRGPSDKSDIAVDSLSLKSGPCS